MQRWHLLGVAMVATSLASGSMAQSICDPCVDPPLPDRAPPKDVPIAVEVISNANFSPCFGLPPGRALTDCARKEVRAGDRHLSFIVRDVTKKLSPENRKSFHRSQVEWKASRDAECHRKRRDVDPSVADSVYLSCFQTLTDKRVSELQEMLDGR